MMLRWSSSLLTTTPCFLSVASSQVLCYMYAQWVLLLSFWQMFSSQVLCTMSAQFLTFFQAFLAAPLWWLPLHILQRLLRQSEQMLFSIHLKPLFPRYRGALGTCMQLMVTLGIFFVNLNCETDWRLLSGICIVFPAVLGLWMFWMPRSVLLIILSHYLSFSNTLLCLGYPGHCGCPTLMSFIQYLSFFHPLLCSGLQSSWCPRATSRARRSLCSSSAGRAGTWRRSWTRSRPSSLRVRRLAVSASLRWDLMELCLSFWFWFFVSLADLEEERISEANVYFSCSDGSSTTFWHQLRFVIFARDL